MQFILWTIHSCLPPSAFYSHCSSLSYLCLPESIILCSKPEKTLISSKFKHHFVTLAEATVLVKKSSLFPESLKMSYILYHSALD